MRRRNFGLVAAGILLVTLVTPTSAVSAEPEQDAVAVGVSSTSPLPDGPVTQGDLQGLNQALVAPSDVSAQAGVPSGYKLILPGYRRTDFIYDSN